MSGEQPSAQSLERLIAAYTKKSGIVTHPGAAITESVRTRLARHLNELGTLLCPCRFYPDKQGGGPASYLDLPLSGVQILPLPAVCDRSAAAEYLPGGHPGRDAYGVVADPTPEQGRPLRHRADEREAERRERPS
jgi:ferredoxin-thioredoxin reductase catalytic chain